MGHSLTKAVLKLELSKWEICREVSNLKTVNRIFNLFAELQLS